MTLPSPSDCEVAIYLHEQSMENVRFVDDAKELHSTKPLRMENRYLVRGPYRCLRTTQLRSCTEGYLTHGIIPSSFKSAIVLITHLAKVTIKQNLYQGDEITGK